MVSIKEPEEKPEDKTEEEIPVEDKPVEPVEIEPQQSEVLQSEEPEEQKEDISEEKPEEKKTPHSPVLEPIINFVKDLKSPKKVRQYKTLHPKTMFLRHPTNHPMKDVSKIWSLQGSMYQ